MSNVEISNNKYNLEGRTQLFSVTLIQLIKPIKVTMMNENIIKQLLKSGTSVGANYCEANGAESKRDFKHKIAICKKEAKETYYWLNLLLNINTEIHDSGKKIIKECHELILIFSKIYSSSK